MGGRIWEEVWVWGEASKEGARGEGTSGDMSLTAGASVAGRRDSITWCRWGKTVTEERNGGGRTDSRKAEWECSTNGIAEKGIPTKGNTEKGFNGWIAGRWL